MNQTLNIYEKIVNLTEYNKYAGEAINQYLNVQDDGRIDHLGKYVDQADKEHTLWKELKEHSDKEMKMRNKIMTERVSKLIQTSNDSKLFFAFGVLHFVGDNSVVQYLREKGHTVERVTANENV